MLEFSGAALSRGARDIELLAAEFRCSPAAIRAVLQVETAGAGFLPDCRPKILFEAAVFSRLTQHRYDAIAPNISAPTWNRSLYGAGGAHQYDRLAQAMKLDRLAALKSASWGLPQILGINFGQCGFDDVEAFVRAMISGEPAQLMAFGHFCEAKQLDRDLAASPPDFDHFALRYNGPGQVAHYSGQLQAAYKRWLDQPSAKPNPAPRTDDPVLWHAALRLGSTGPEVAALQDLLNHAGIDPPLKTDGQFGPDTNDAVRAVQLARGLAVDGWAGPATWKVLSA